MTGDEELLAKAEPSWMADNKPALPEGAFEPSKDWPMSPTLQRKERILSTDVLNIMGSGGAGTGGSGTGVKGQLASIVALNGYPRNALLDGTDLGPA